MSRRSARSLAVLVSAIALTIGGALLPALLSRGGRCCCWVLLRPR